MRPRYSASKFRIVLFALLLGAIVFVGTGYAQDAAAPAGLSGRGVSVPEAGGPAVRRWGR